MKLIYLLCAMTSFFMVSESPQNDGSYFGGKYKIITKYKNSKMYRLYDFSREGVTMKAKYFATNAYTEYNRWKSGKNILLIAPGAFSNSLEPENADPVGLTVDNGRVVNRNIDHIMDGMVIVYNGGRQQGGVAVVDLDMKPVRVEKTYGSGIYNSYYPRSSSSDKENFIQWGKYQGVTLFQTQLLYSKDKYSNFTNLKHGGKRERRFLALCKKAGVVHHVVIDAPEYEYLNVAAKEAKEVLEGQGLSVLYVMNLDTGRYDILHAHDGNTLQNLRPRVNLRDATNLIVYYKD
ncbi:MAG: hypothetical protein ACRBFS_14020 [Aureispira sp.]